VTTSPIVAAISSVAQPMIAPTSAAIGACSKKRVHARDQVDAAVTIVAAWIRADTGVGPSIASAARCAAALCRTSRTRRPAAAGSPRRGRRRCARSPPRRERREEVERAGCLKMK
jgi:hypothetical protein